MPIKNYTTKIDASVTVGKIQAVLAKHGAKKIMIEYDECCNVSAVTFIIMTGKGMQGVRLPADPERVLAVLQQQKVKADLQQARRVAWRILKDWLEAQLALLETELVTIDQVMLPYFVTQSGDTYYDLYLQNKLAIGYSDESSR